MEDRLGRINQLLAEIHHVAIATVCDDGSPLSTPLYARFDHQLNWYWSSRSDSRHSQNIHQRQRVFLTLFDSREGHGGLYAAGKATQLQDIADLSAALSIFKPRLRSSSLEAELAHFSGDGPQRLYRFKPEQSWVNQSVRDAAGRFIKDERFAIQPADLILPVY